MHIRHGEPNKAIADSTKAIQINSKAPDAYGARGVAYSAIGESERTIADLRRAIRLNPDYAHLYSGWVVAREAARHLDVKKDNDMQRGRPRAVYTGILLMIGISTIAVVALAGD